MIKNLTMGVKMISYKQWQVMNESFVGTFASILSNPVAVGGIVGGIGGTEAAREAALEEAKAKKKNMDAGCIGNEKDAETGDGEVVDASSEKDEKGGDDKGGKKLPPWLKGKEDKKEAKDTGSFDPEGDQAGKVLPWLNRKGNHGAQDKKSAADKLCKISDKVKKESQEAFDDMFFASLRDQIGMPNVKHSGGFSEISEDQLLQAQRPEPPIEGEEPKAGEVGFAPNNRMFQLAGMTDDEGNSLIAAIPTLGEAVKKN